MFGRSWLGGRRSELLDEGELGVIGDGGGGKPVSGGEKNCGLRDLKRKKQTDNATY